MSLAPTIHSSIPHRRLAAVFGVVNASRGVVDRCGASVGVVRVVDAPTGPGVYYLLTRTRRLSYVGKAANLRRRLGDHARDPRWARIADVRWELVGSDAAATAREADVIVALQPARNRAIRHDEYYSFVTVGS